MKNKLRKSLNLSLVGCIFLSTVASSTLNAGGGIMGNFNVADYGPNGVTKIGQVYNDGQSTGYAIGGKYQMKLTPNQPTAWFNVQSPQVSLGCAGMSIKGMFGSLLNISQIGDQLKDAGAAFAWGIILGLVTSLPGIKEVFDTINNWAAQLQSLIADACNIGKKLASESAFKTEMDSAFQSLGTSFKQSNAWVGDMQKTTGEISTFIGDALTNANEWASSTDTKQDKYGAVFVLLQTAFGNPGPVSNAISFSARDRNKKVSDYFDNVALTSTTASTDKFQIFGPGDLTVKISPTGFSAGELSDWQLKMVTTIIASNISMRSGISNEHWIKAKDFAEYSAIVVNNGSGDKNVITQSIEELAKVLPTANDSKTMSKSQLNTTDIVNWLLQGTFPTGKLQMSKIVGIGSPAKVSGTPKLFIIDKSEDPDILVETSGWGSVFARYGNVKELSEAQIACITRNNYSGGTVTLSGGGTKSCLQVPPVLMPSATRYMQIYSQSTVADQDEYRSMLVDYNSYKWMDMIQDLIESNVGPSVAKCSQGLAIALSPGGNSASEVNSKASPTGCDLSQINSDLVRLNIEMNKIREGFADVVTPGVTAQQMDRQMEQAFKDLRERNAQRGMSGTPR